MYKNLILFYPDSDLLASAFIVIETDYRWEVISKMQTPQMINVMKKICQINKKNSRIAAMQSGIPYTPMDFTASL